MKDKTKVFQKYAEVYDILYRDKNYESECDFLEDVFSSYGKNKIGKILDLGCGTASHAIPLAHRGYHVVGADISEQMLDIAKKKAEDVKLSDVLEFHCADIRTLNLNDTFDAVICMFAVLGYQTSNASLLSTLHTVRRHLKPGGLFICDFWYGPAVLKQYPSDRVKITEDSDNRIIRLVHPEINTTMNIVEVNYHIIRIRKAEIIQETREVHTMRYIFYPEIDFFMSQSGLKQIHFGSFSDLGQAATEETWNVSSIAYAI